MTRRCSHCSNNGHNSRTCPARPGGSGGGGGGGGGVRLFGVQLTQRVGSMKKSASSPAIAGGQNLAGDLVVNGYVSDDTDHTSCSINCRSERKKGVPWTEEEHRKFLLGLQNLGKGDWRGIARNYVVSRTPTQVASHAQKYFIRQHNTNRRKRRSSLFDMVSEMPSDQIVVHEEQFLPHSPPNELAKTSQLPALHLGQQRTELAESSKTNHSPELGGRMSYNNTQLAMAPTFYPGLLHVPLPFWALSTNRTGTEQIIKEENIADTHQIFKPTPVVLRKETVNMDEVSIMSKLSINEHATSFLEPSALSLKLQGPSSSRQSAFHINSSSVTGPDLNQSTSSPIHAV